MSLLPQALEEHASFVRALARSLVHNPHGADDIVQETWVAVLGSKDSPAATTELAGSSTGEDFKTEVAAPRLFSWELLFCVLSAVRSD
jgi:hypothetical protein